MTIKVLGSGCATCAALYEMAKDIAKDFGEDTKVEYITDISEIIKLGIMQSPVLVVNEKPVMIGFVNNRDKVKALIEKAIS